MKRLPIGQVIAFDDLAMKSLASTNARRFYYLTIECGDGEMVAIPIARPILDHDIKDRLPETLWWKHRILNNLELSAYQRAHPEVTIRRVELETVATAPERLLAKVG